MRWSRGERETGSIGFSVLNADAVQLRYRQDGQDVIYSVAVTYMRLVSGGQRPWWRCPTCWRRCGVIYGCRRGGRYFVCRICGDLAYASQHTRQRKYEAWWEGLEHTRWGRELLALAEAERAQQEAELCAMVREAVGEAPLPKRGRPRTKRKYAQKDTIGDKAPLTS